MSCVTCDPKSMIRTASGVASDGGIEQSRRWRAGIGCMSVPPIQHPPGHGSRGARGRGLHLPDQLAIRPSRLLREVLLEHPDDRRQHGTADASARELRDDRSEIEAASCARSPDAEQGRQDLAAEPAANKSRKRIAERAERFLPELRPGHIAANHTTDE